MSTVPGVGEERVYFHTSKYPYNTETVKVSNPFENKVYSAEIRPGSQDLEGKVKTLETYKKDLEKAKSPQGKLQRLAGVLMIAALVAGIAVGITQGITPLAITSGVLLGLLGAGYAGYKGINSGVALAGFTAIGPLWFLYDMFTMESQSKSKLDSQQKDVKELVNFLSDQKPHIDKWLRDKKTKLETQIKDHRKSLKPDLDLKQLKEATQKIEKAESEIENINKTLEKLENSHKAAVKYLLQNLAS